MIGQVIRRAAQPNFRRAQVRLMSETPNPVKEQQKAFQKGATPYLRGDADPTYLRNKSDPIVVGGGLAAAAFGVLMVFYSQYRLITGKKE
eukprot:CAMPEP_0171504760 /NCGR_PEP_ID=MMETSP0958-20121227/11778_1 /TAXON_ID=87120 /ORGANISM="Aurantiochytrium limacinum, Strain ATCCMYA-1381" /LENGTH=89 /DNA_ID=CAMNT_0012040693 /DNA_START=31 /DNA_END=300 /DNA_ORIENTATION=-